MDNLEYYNKNLISHKNLKSGNLYLLNIEENMSNVRYGLLLIEFDKAEGEFVKFINHQQYAGETYYKFGETYSIMDFWFEENLASVFEFNDDNLSFLVNL